VKMKFVLDFTQRTVRLHGGVKVSMLIPKQQCNSITAAMDTISGIRYFIANGSGFTYLSQMFSLCKTLGKNEFICLPLSYVFHEAYDKEFPNERRVSRITLSNYCTTQLDIRDRLTAMKTSVYRETVVTRSGEVSGRDTSSWKRRRRVTAKQHSGTLFISANKDLFQDMELSCERLAEYGNHTEENQYPPHCHYDMEENTSKSPGFRLIYFHYEDKNEEEYRTI